MILILAAVSLHHALGILTPEEKNDMKRKSIRSRDYVYIQTQKIVQNLLSRNLKDKNNVVIWYDVINTSISRHDSYNFNALSVPGWIDVFKSRSRNSVLWFTATVSEHCTIWMLWMF